MAVKHMPIKLVLWQAWKMTEAGNNAAFQDRDFIRNLAVLCFAGERNHTYCRDDKSLYSSLRTAWEMPVWHRHISCFKGEEEMAEMTLLAFAIVAFIGIATPGPTVLLALANGSRFGVRRALTGMAGAVLSDFVLIGAVALGLGALLAASEFWFGVVKWVGICYLAFLGAMLLRSRGSLDGALQSADTSGATSARSIFLKSFLVAVTNPKGYLFFSAFLPQFIDPAAPQIQQYAVLALVFAGIDFIVMFGYALLGSQAVRLLRKSGALWLDRICGGALLTLAASLAFYRRASA
jgi:threonine/homoserine/homoserine lactone efflux protein